MTCYTHTHVCVCVCVCYTFIWATRRRRQGAPFYIRLWPQSVGGYAVYVSSVRFQPWCSAAMLLLVLPADALQLPTLLYSQTNPTDTRLSTRKRARTRRTQEERTIAPHLHPAPFTFLQCAAFLSAPRDHTAARKSSSVALPLRTGAGACACPCGPLLLFRDDDEVAAATASGPPRAGPSTV